MRHGLTGLALAGAFALTMAPAHARDQDRPITDKDVSAVDVATTPITDLNLRKDEIPAVLILAEQRPYDVTHLPRCSQVAAAVGELDAVLGDDIDLPQKGEKLSPGRVAQSVVGAFIPFRGVIRELSGANGQQRQVDAAIQAGIARRAFLKGYGQAKGCRYPARSVTPEVWAERVGPIRPVADVEEVAEVKK